MKPLTVCQKAQLALLVTWCMVGALVFTARQMKPTAASVLAFLQAGAGPAGKSAFAAELPLRLSRLNFFEQERILRSPEFAQTLAAFDAAQLRTFLGMATPQGVCDLLAETRKLPETRREAFFREAVDEMRSQVPPEDPRVNGAFLRNLAQRGIGIYEDKATAEDREVMMPFIRQLSDSIEWL
jgi:hypothetical protein